MSEAGAGSPALSHSMSPHWRLTKIAAPIAELTSFLGWLTFVPVLPPLHPLRPPLLCFVPAVVLLLCSLAQWQQKQGPQRLGHPVPANKRGSRAALVSPGP
eukprot:1156040-Pelagomonas_calceolata.AAC.2